METIGEEREHTEPVVAYFDGLVEPINPGGYACGGWVVAPHPGLGDAAHTGLTGCRCYGHGQGWTNNRAEYMAALDALHALSSTGWRGPVLLQGDSKLVINQTTGTWACNAPHLVELRGQLRHALTGFAHVEVRWIPREANHVADSLSRKAYEEARRGRREEEQQP